MGIVRMQVSFDSEEIEQAIASNKVCAVMIFPAGMRVALESSRRPRIKVGTLPAPTEDEAVRYAAGVGLEMPREYVAGCLVETLIEREMERTGYEAIDVINAMIRSGSDVSPLGKKLMPGEPFDEGMVVTCFMPHPADDPEVEEVGEVGEAAESAQSSSASSR